MSLTIDIPKPYIDQSTWDSLDFYGRSDLVAQVEKTGYTADAGWSVSDISPPGFLPNGAGGAGLVGNGVDLLTGNNNGLPTVSTTSASGQPSDIYGSNSIASGSGGVGLGAPSASGVSASSGVNWWIIAGLILSAAAVFMSNGGGGNTYVVR